MTEHDWREACDGSVIEVVSEGSAILGVNASAAHFALIIEWQVHYINGEPTTAEYRETERGRISEGDKAGDLSGINRLKRLQTFKAREGGFQISDDLLKKQLSEILGKANIRR